MKCQCYSILKCSAETYIFSRNRYLCLIYFHIYLIPVYRPLRTRSWVSTALVVYFWLQGKLEHWEKTSTDVGRMLYPGYGLTPIFEELAGLPWFPPSHSCPRCRPD